MTSTPWRFALLLSLSSLSAFTQQANPAASQQDVTLDVVVTDQAGTPIRGLQQQDFSLLDDKHPQALTSFHAVDVEAGTPAPNIEIVLVIDAINASPLKAELQREGIKKFLQSNGGKLAQPVSVVLVADTQIRSKPSTDGNAQAALLSQDVTGLRTVNRSQGASGITQRFQLSLKALESLAAFEGAKPGRKLIVWVSPDWPLLAASASDVTSQDQAHIFHSIVALSTQLRRDHITLYNVQTRGVAGTSVGQFYNYEQFLKGVKSPDQAYPPALSLQVLTVQTGGRLFNQSNDLPGDIAREIAKAASEGEVFYTLSFAPGRADKVNEYHSLEVKVAKPGLEARTRTGYYAQP